MGDAVVASSEVELRASWFDVAMHGLRLLRLMPCRLRGHALGMRVVSEKIEDLAVVPMPDGELELVETCTFELAPVCRTCSAA